MAEIYMVEVDTKARKRKPNFSVNEIAITENVEKNLAIIQSKLTNNVTKNNEVWEDNTSGECGGVCPAELSLKSKKNGKIFTAQPRKNFLHSKEKAKWLVVDLRQNPYLFPVRKSLRFFEEIPALRSLHSFEAGM